MLLREGFVRRFKSLLDDRYTIPSLDRAIEVLAVLSEEREGLNLAELTRRTGVPKSTLYRILMTLRGRECVFFDEDRKVYRLGLRLWELGSVYLEQSDLYSAAVPYMKELAETCKESIFLGVLHGAEVTYVRRMESPESVMAVQKLGQRAPAYCTATGRAMLAFMPEQDFNRILDEQELDVFTPKTDTDPARLREALARVQEEGVAIVDGEYNPQLLCVAAPVRDATHQAVAAVTVAMLSAQASDTRVQNAAKAVRQAAERLSRNLGYRGDGKAAPAGVYAGSSG